MTFLKKLGIYLVKGLSIAAAIGGVSLPFLGSGKTGQVATTATNDLTQIAGMAVTIEAALAGQTGTAKLAALVPLVKGIISTSELVVGKKVADQATFDKGCTEVAQGVVDIMNGLHGDAAQPAVSA